MKNAAFSELFLPLWEKYFPSAGLPIGYYYTDQAQEADRNETINLDRCLIGNLMCWLASSPWQITIGPIPMA